MKKLNHLNYIYGIAFFCISLFCVVFMGCDNKNKPGIPFEDTHWTFVKSKNNSTQEINKYPEDADNYIIHFRKDKLISFPRYCNYSYGKYQVSENKLITFSEIGPGTEMNCVGFSEWENLIIGNLIKSQTFRMTTKQLIIYCDDNILYFQKHNDIISLKDTKWKLVKNKNNKTNEVENYPDYLQQYTIHFEEDGSLEFPDNYCNYSYGMYSVNESFNYISFNKMGPATKVNCEGFNEWENLLVQGPGTPVKFNLSSDELTLKTENYDLFFKLINAGKK